LKSANVTRLREQGLKCKIFEAGAASGGTWYWNCYPGARVDSEVPFYQLFDEELWQEWTFTERFPERKELCQYFDWVVQRLDMKKDIVYNCRIAGADWDDSHHQWIVRGEDGMETHCRYLIIATGVLSTRYVPAFNGLHTFKGEWYHSGLWPQNSLDLRGKRIAVIGTGTSAIQIIQETGPSAEQLTVFQRTPNYALPMHQKPLDRHAEAERKASGEYKKTLDICRTTFSGFPIVNIDKNVFDDGPEERVKIFHDLLVVKGGFHSWIGTYKDVLTDAAANHEAYRFWRDTVRKRISDPTKAKLLAPDNPPHPWGTKRPSLEQNYYEVMSLPNVDIIDVNSDPIIEITENGIRTQSGLVAVDVIVFATGWDAGAGGLLTLDLQGVNGESITDHFKEGYNTALGVALAGFPNMFYINSIGSPAYLANGPSDIQSQADWIKSVIMDLNSRDVSKIEAKKSTETAWRKACDDTWNATLFPRANSWYQGSNIPGKRVETIGWYVTGMRPWIRKYD
jgi:cation diffusion facilitator CzcD-associated flavoprotein CzcO